MIVRERQTALDNEEQARKRFPSTPVIAERYAEQASALYLALIAFGSYAFARLRLDHPSVNDHDAYIAAIRAAVAEEVPA